MSRNLNIPAARKVVFVLLFRDQHGREDLSVNAVAEVVGVINPIPGEVPVLFVPQHLGPD